MSAKKTWSLIVLGAGAWFAIRRFYTAWKGSGEETVQGVSSEPVGYAPGWNAR